ncbi:MAG TPA: Ig-like domain-containing protein, partial [Pyrinomonadaceae bacterium]|nr:Ig-like domain-containing protein [Pyrinomonadaceae bacterium]
AVAADGTLTYTPANNANGSATVSLTLKDDGGTANRGLDTSGIQTFTINVTAVNDPPVANAGPDQTVECAGGVTLNGSGSFDIEGDPLTYEWREGTVLLGTGVMLNTSLPFGAHVVTLRVIDPSGAFGEDSLNVNVIDTTSPTIMLNNLTVFLHDLTIVFNDSTVTVNGLTFPFNGFSFSISGHTFSFNGQTVTIDGDQFPLDGQIITIWPPNKKYHTVKVSDFVRSAADACDASVDVDNVVIAAITSDEGNAASNDVVIDTNCKSAQLRADRNGTGNGRVYTITLRVRDMSGNARTITRKVTVPHDAAHPAVDSGIAYTVNSNCP